MSGTATVEDGTQPWESSKPADAQQLHRVIAWSLEEPGRCGESLPTLRFAELHDGDAAHRELRLIQLMKLDHAEQLADDQPPSIRTPTPATRWAAATCHVPSVA